MAIWRVKVLCVGERPPRKLGKPYRPVRVYRTALIESVCSSVLEAGDEIMAFGARYVEDSAAVSVRWKEFTALEASIMKFPLLIEEPHT